MTASQPGHDPRTAEGVRIVAVHTLPGQRQPLRVTAALDLDEFACIALPAAARLFSVHVQAVKPDSGAALAHDDVAPVVVLPAE